MAEKEAAPNRVPRWLGRAVWGGAVFLTVIGVVAALGRGVFPADLAARAEPLRRQALDVLDREDPFAAERVEELERFDGRFGAHPLRTQLHVLPGSIFLVLALLQFSPRIRSRHIRFHRYAGRFLMLVGLVTTMTALYFGLLMPYGGSGEAAIIGLVSILFLASMIRAYLAIRRHQVARHREWMIRAFAVAIGVSVVRVVAAVLDGALTPAGVRPAEVFVASLWAGWGITLGAAELWIRYTRPNAGTVAAAEGGA